MSIHRELLFNRRAGWLGNVALPFLLFFEGLGPIIEVLGLLSIVVGFWLGWISLQGFLAITFAAIGLGMVLSLTSLLLEESAFHTYSRLRHVMILIGASLLENIGYRQLMAWWRLRGLWQWMLGRDVAWGEMVRSGKWQDEPRAADRFGPVPAQRGTSRGKRIEPVAPAITR
jgi:hypothetical protein